MVLRARCHSLLCARTYTYPLTSYMLPSVLHATYTTYHMLTMSTTATVGFAQSTSLV